MYPECEIYDNLAWDLPGFRRRRWSAAKSSKILRVVRTAIQPQAE